MVFPLLLLNEYQRELNTVPNSHLMQLSLDFSLTININVYFCLHLILHFIIFSLQYPSVYCLYFLTPLFLQFLTNLLFLTLLSYSFFTVLSQSTFFLIFYSSLLLHFSLQLSRSTLSNSTLLLHFHPAFVNPNFLLFLILFSHQPLFIIENRSREWKNHSLAWEFLVK